MIKIVDGDIIDVQLNGSPVRVSCINVNTPKTQHLAPVKTYGRHGKVTRGFSTADPAALA